MQDRLDRFAEDRGFVNFGHWRIGFSHRTRLFFRYKWKQLVCPHRTVVLCLNWTGSSFLCHWCLKHLPFDDVGYRMIKAGSLHEGALYRKQPVTPGSDEE